MRSGKFLVFVGGGEKKKREKKKRAERASVHKSNPDVHQSKEQILSIDTNHGRTR